MGVITVKVRTTPTRLLVANPKRKYYAVLNPSSVDVYVGFDNQVSTTGVRKGIVVKANGGAYGDEWHKGEVWGIASTETEVTVIEISEGE